MFVIQTEFIKIPELRSSSKPNPKKTITCQVMRLQTGI